MNAARTDAQGGLRKASRKGMTLIEVLVAFAMLSLALLGFVKVILCSTTTTDAQHETMTAKEAARQAIETLQAASFSDVFALYNDDPNDDPGGAGTAPGSALEVTGLNAPAGAANGAVGQILFPTVDDPAEGLQLREDVVDDSLGMPRDLDGDGQVDDVDHAGDYQLLPVRIRLQWTGRAGLSTIEIKTLLADY